MNPAAVVVPALAGLSLFLVFLGLGRSLGAKDQRVDDRLGRYASRSNEAETVKAKGGSPIGAKLDKALSNKSFAANTARELARADLKLTVSEFVVLNVLAALVGFLLGYLLYRSPFAAIGFGVVGSYLPKFFVHKRQGNRRKRFNEQLSDGINLLVNGLRSGYSQMQAMETVSREMPPPISVEFGRVVQEVGLGISMNQALDNMLRRIQSDDLDLMITAVKVQHEVGGNLAEILDTISYTIRERVRIEGEIRVLTSMQMLSANIISLLPIALGLIMYLLSSDYMGQMFEETCGWIMLGTAAMVVVLGYMAIRRIIAIEV
ncbi:MAG: secretion system protein F [Chloroflexi bacterium]|nr:secretion system protein F [Chloroflexota bacterium]